MEFLRSCDTFVVLPPLTKNGNVIFGKNADRPEDEVQELVFIKGKMQDEKVKCTYITIDGCPKLVNSVILSKPAWMWGAEMGSNDKNVVIGNEAVWTLNNKGDSDPSKKRLLGMDLLRLGLERGNSAEEALDVITSLLEQYGQGGPCSEFDSDLYYHNSFLIADPREAWVLETSGKLWAAEKITTGYRNISNGLTITNKVDKHSAGLLEQAKSLGFWDGKNQFDFKKSFSASGDIPRQIAGQRLLKKYSHSKNFDVKDMFSILRDKESGICCAYDEGFPTQGSQVSLLSAEGVSVHWFTATPDPSLSYFKPFVFTPNVEISGHTRSPMVPGWRHVLYKLHYEKVLTSKKTDLFKKIHELEEKSLMQIHDFIRKHEREEINVDKMDTILKECVESEIALYNSELN